MEKYRDYAPTAFDAKGLNGDREGIADYLVVLSRTRDSDAWELSNFRVALKRLGGESDDVQIHRFGHWAYGWLELLLVNPDSIEATTVAEDIEHSLDSYPILDDMDASELEWEINTELGGTYNDETGEWEW